jgi:hypothetical protein
MSERCPFEAQVVFSLGQVDMVSCALPAARLPYARNHEASHMKGHGV